MKKAINIILSVGLLFGTLAHAQTEEISRDWTSFVQSVDVQFDQKARFKVIAHVKVLNEDERAWAGLWARVDNKEGGSDFFDNMGDRPITADDWKSYTIEGYLDENSKKLNFGGLCLSNGDFYFDNFEIHLEQKDGSFNKMKIDNPSFETEVKNQIIPKWNGGIGVQPVRIKEYNILSSSDAVEGQRSLKIEGRGVLKDTSNLIGPVSGYTPQVGTLVTMLNNLSKRVENAVGSLDQHQTDWLFDEEANSIGALIMHLAAAEAFYQVYTFENRDFNDEEKARWNAALNLGEDARKLFQGKPIHEYLEVYKEVRQKTLEELKKRDDTWLAEEFPGSDTNIHYAWFHVMEHQSSHLGQILMIKKRIPKPGEINLSESIKD